jgi:hypothetical protein
MTMPDGAIPDPTLFSGFAPAMSPGQAGVGGFVAPTGDDPWTAAGQQGSGAGTDWAGIAKAIGQGAQQTQQQQPAIPNAPVGQSSAGQASSGAYQGSPAGMNALTQMLMARVLALRDASDPRTAKPVNLQSQQRPAGLLGL